MEGLLSTVWRLDLTKVIEDQLSSEISTKWEKL